MSKARSNGMAYLVDIEIMLLSYYNYNTSLYVPGDVFILDSRTV